MNIDYPYHFDGRGRTAATDGDAHIRDLIEQVLFTAPGERVNRPDFGCGLLQLIYEPNSSALATALQYTAQASLQRWLSDVIEVQALNVESDQSSLRVSVQYIVRRTNQPVVFSFTETR